MNCYTLDDSQTTMHLGDVNTQPFIMPRTSCVDTISRDVISYQACFDN